jgi:alkanesulfonate monooxygenase SsuD/methylene tetrahydromethanopterin reductase-like flavin-dependent oxidoreductase (luciferase family)
LLAAVAARTRTIRLGTAVVVLPLHHPVRVAEEYALLDVLSDGRVELGIGRGYQPVEFEGYGVDPSRTREMVSESVDVIRGAWTEDNFAYDGRLYRLKGVSIRPKPIQRPHPPLWMAALSPESFDLSARLGVNLLCAPVFGFDADAGIAEVERYRSACAARNDGAQAKRIATLAITYVAETSERARSELRDCVLWYYRTLARYIARGGGRSPAAGYDTYEHARVFLETVDWDTALRRGAVICGSPEEVSERIEDLRVRCAMTDYLAWTRIGGLARERVMRSNELLATRVMPRFR